MPLLFFCSFIHAPSGFLWYSLPVLRSSLSAFSFDFGHRRLNFKEARAHESFSAPTGASCLEVHLKSQTRQFSAGDDAYLRFWNLRPQLSIEKI